MIFQKSRFRRVQTHISNFVVSGLEFTEILAGHERNRCRSHVSPTLDPLGIYLGQNSKVVRNRSKLCTFYPRIICEVRSPELWDLVLTYKTEPTCDHVVNFQGDRPRKLRDTTLK